jgi:hypothetical protein
MTKATQYLVSLIETYSAPNMNKDFNFHTEDMSGMNSLASHDSLVNGGF